MRALRLVVGWVPPKPVRLGPHFGPGPFSAGDREGRIDESDVVIATSRERAKKRAIGRRL